MTKMLLLPLATLLAGCVDDNANLLGEYFEDDAPTNGGGSQPLPPRDRPEDSGPAVCGKAEVHVIGVYETRDDHSFEYHPTGDAVVRIERGGAHSLVLSSYEPTRWRIELANGARIRAIHLVGYHSQTVTPPHEEITITTNTYTQTQSGACGYSWPYNGEGCNTHELLAIAKKLTGNTDVTSFHGCYRATKWTLDHNANASANCASAGYEMNTYFGACSKADDTTTSKLDDTTNAVRGGSIFIDSSTGADRTPID
jgi:hypothetical protein